MKPNIFSQFASKSLLVTVSVFAVMAFAEHRSTSNKDDLAKLKTEVDELTKRTNILEQILFSTAKLNQSTAERRLKRAQSRLSDSRSLYARGLISAFQIQAEQVSVDIAKREFELALADGNHNQKVCELEVLGAKRRLQVAEERLESRSQLARRGHVSKDSLDLARADVETATAQLNHFKNKLILASKLDSLNPAAKEKETESDEKK